MKTAIILMAALMASNLTAQAQQRSYRCQVGNTTVYQWTPCPDPSGNWTPPPPRVEIDLQAVETMRAQRRLDVDKQRINERETARLEADAQAQRNRIDAERDRQYQRATAERRDAACAKNLRDQKWLREKAFQYQDTWWKNKLQDLKDDYTANCL